MQTGYNEQIIVDNKNGIIIATEVTQDANDQNQLLPMIKKTQNNLQEALNLTTEESEELIHKLDILADNGYYKDEVVHKNYHEEHYNILMPNRKQTSQQKDYLRRKSQRKENHNKKDGFSKTQHDKRRRKPLLHMSRKQNTTSTTSLSRKIR